MTSVLFDVGYKLQHDLTGKRFGHMAVMERVIDKTKSMTQWICKCDCGTIKVMTGWVLRNSKSDPPIHCGCLSYLGRPKNRRYKDFKQASFNHVLGMYQQAAKRRELSWELSNEQFQDFINKSCHYCGQLPSRLYNPYQYQKKPKNNLRQNADILINGIDRIDPEKGYSLDNCVPCCQDCNYGKHTKTQKAFLMWINRVWNFQNKETQ